VESATTWNNVDALISHVKKDSRKGKVILGMIKRIEGGMLKGTKARQFTAGGTKKRGGGAPALGKQKRYKVDLVKNDGSQQRVSRGRPSVDCKEELLTGGSSYWTREGGGTHRIQVVPGV